jgi:hypothetical protein
MKTPRVVGEAAMFEQPKDYEAIQHKLENEARWCLLMERSTTVLAVVLMFVVGYLVFGLYV